MTKATIGRWGQSLAVRLPAHLAEQLDLTEKAQVEIEVVDGRLVMSPAPSRRRRVTLEELFAGYDEAELEAMREGYAAAAAEFDWGPDVGAEILPPYEPDESGSVPTPPAKSSPTRRKHAASVRRREGPDL